MARTPSFTDVDLIVALNMFDGNITKAAKKLGVSRDAVVKRKAQLPEEALGSDMDKFNAKLYDTFSQLQQMLLHSITPAKINRASLSQVVMAIGLMEDKKRLIKGQPTEHIAHVHKTMLHPEDKKLIRQLIKQRTERLLEENNKDKGEQ